MISKPFSVARKSRNIEKPISRKPVRIGTLNSLVEGCLSSPPETNLVDGDHAEDLDVPLVSQLTSSSLINGFIRYFTIKTFI